ncbi:MAG: chromate transporter [Clostridia bacterium]|nr:chromate transporter [Clostridia bacterium]
MKKDWNILIKLFMVFFKIGAFTFGGGYAMFSLIEHVCVDEKKWITHEDMMNVTVIAESTPGPVAINCATFVGYRVAGVTGAVIATLGMVLPSFAIILVIANFLDRFLEIELIRKAFLGIKAGVGFLIFTTGINMFKKMKKTKMNYVFSGISFAALLLIDFLAIRFSAVLVMLICGLISLSVFILSGRREGEI